MKLHSDIFGTKYKGCTYRKVYEVFNEKQEVDGHTFSARQAKEMINKWKAVEKERKVSL